MAKRQTKTVEAQVVTITDRNVTDFFMNEYFDYAKYTIANRALPSIIDGLKPGGRKLMHAAFKILRTDKETNLIDLVGTTLSYSKYHHGDASLTSTIETLAGRHANTLAPLQIIGSEAELRSAESAAPRYLGVQLSKWAKLLQKDQHILEYNFDGDFQIEPTYYLPIIPMALVARTTGMATGYKYDAQVSYNPADIARQCISVLTTGHLSGKLTPHIEQFGGSFVQIDDRIWANGIYTINKDHIIINEFSPGETFSSFEATLKDLLIKGQILNWENQSKGGSIQYRIDVNASLLERQIQKKLMGKTYKLGAFLKRPTYTLLNEHGKIAIFTSAEEVLRYFVNFRLGLYDKLKSVNIANLEQRILKLNQIRQFLDMYFDGTIIMSKDVPIERTYAILDSKVLPRSLADTSMKKLTKEEYDKLTNDIAELCKELEVITKTPTLELYLSELSALVKEFEPAFPLQPFSIKQTEE